jgi:hypothetical protein
MSLLAHRNTSASMVPYCSDQIHDPLVAHVERRLLLGFSALRRGYDQTHRFRDDSPKFGKDRRRGVALVVFLMADPSREDETALLEPGSSRYAAPEPVPAVRINSEA